MAEELNESVKIAVRANESFAYDIYKALINDNNNSNILFSPLVTETLLALFYMAAEDQTADEMLKILHLPSDKISVAKNFKNLYLHIQSSLAFENVTLKMANKIFLKNSIVLSQRFNNIMKESFYVESENVNFTNQSETLSKINNWMTDKTEYKIQNIFDDLDSNSTTLLLSAIYFNGLWDDPFYLSLTPMYFFINENKTIKLPQLSRVGMFNYYEDIRLNAKLIEMPYRGEDYSLVIILPNDIDGLANVEANLPADLSQFVASEIRVSIPKFTMETSVDLTSILKKMGMTTVFSNDANLSGLMSKETKEQVKISAVIQKCRIGVDKGDAKKCGGSRDAYTAEFCVNHPFLFMLTERKTKTIILFGKCVNPTLNI